MQGSGVFGGFRGIWEVSSEHIIADEAADDGEPVAKKSSLSWRACDWTWYFSLLILKKPFDSISSSSTSIDILKLNQLHKQHWVTRPKKFIETDTETFFETKIFETDTETCFRDQMFSRPIPRLFFETEYFPDQYRNFFSRSKFLRPRPILSKNWDTTINIVQVSYPHPLIILGGSMRVECFSYIHNYYKVKSTTSTSSISNCQS